MGSPQWRGWIPPILVGVVQILLTAKANVNIPLTAMNRYTPLHAAASAGCELVVSQLCQVGTSGGKVELRQLRQLRQTNYIIYIQIYSDCITPMELYSILYYYNMYGA